MLRRVRLFRPAVLGRGFRATQGLAAVEFAILLPVMLLLGVGSVEIEVGVSADRQVALTAGTVANLVAQYQSISASSTMPDILAAASAVLTPYSVANAVVTVSCINIDSGGNATIAWSQALNGPARPAGEKITLPPKLDIPNTSLVWGETSYAYTPLADYMHIGTLQLYSDVYMSPRTSMTIVLAP